MRMFSLQKMAMAFTLLFFACLCSFVSPDAQGDAFSYFSTAILLLSFLVSFLVISELVQVEDLTL